MRPPRGRGNNRHDCLIRFDQQLIPSTPGASIRPHFQRWPARIEESTVLIPEDLAKFTYLSRVGMSLVHSGNKHSLWQISEYYSLP